MKKTRSLNSKDLAYDAIAHDWQMFVDDYDTRRRVEVLVDEFGLNKIAGRRVLDAGCGLGFFSHRMAGLGPSQHTAFDLAPTLVSQLAAKLPTANLVVADLLDLSNVMPARAYDFVISSEVIEHTPDPLLAVRNLCERVADGGWLAISCPNARWKWLLNCAQALRIRKNYQGYENWVTAEALRSVIEKSGLEVVRAEGIHLVPWQVVPKSLLRALDRRLRGASFGFSINHAILARRPFPATV